VGTRHPVNDPLPESLKFVFGSQEHRWNMSGFQQTLGNMIDFLALALGALYILNA
jgi:hypothetical protein